jgi:hypothetical protein
VIFGTSLEMIPTRDPWNWSPYIGNIHATQRTHFSPHRLNNASQAMPAGADFTFKSGVTIDLYRTINRWLALSHQ